MEKLVSLNVVVKPEIKEKLKAAALQMDLKLSDVIRKALKFYLETRSKEKAA